MAAFTCFSGISLPVKTKALPELQFLHSVGDVRKPFATQTRPSALALVVATLSPA